MLGEALGYPVSENFCAPAEPRLIATSNNQLRKAVNHRLKPLWKKATPVKCQVLKGSRTEKEILARESRPGTQRRGRWPGG
jgi:hypothetical protein